eukprot:745791_1
MIVITTLWNAIIINKHFETNGQDAMHQVHNKQIHTHLDSAFRVAVAMRWIHGKQLYIRLGWHEKQSAPNIKLACSMWLQPPSSFLKAYMIVIRSTHRNQYDT